MKHLKILSGLLIAYALNSCNLFPKPDPSLPPETQEGKNTFGCLVNGKVWNANFGTMGDLYGTPLTRAKYDPFREGQFSIKAENNEIINISSWGTPTVRVYELRADSLQLVDFTMSYSNNFCGRYGGHNLTYFKGKLNMKKFDLRTRIAAGTFECTLKTAICDTVKITQGRFDMRF